MAPGGRKRALLLSGRFSLGNVSSGAERPKQNLSSCRESLGYGKILPQQFFGQNRVLPNFGKYLALFPYATVPQQILIAADPVERVGRLSWGIELKIAHLVLGEKAGGLIESQRPEEAKKVVLFLFYFYFHF